VQEVPSQLIFWGTPRPQAALAVWTKKRAQTTRHPTTSRGRKTEQRTPAPSRHLHDPCPAPTSIFTSGPVHLISIIFAEGAVVGKSTRAAPGPPRSELRGFPYLAFGV